ncbi:hypothetical protein ACFFHT_01780 [Gallibacterium melopsittaci]|uniref:Lipoprotein n=1 Tax=Gallibacterium melopsittaci TaxID=516063 RepID=A0ABV6HTV1_9PAST
MKKLLVITLLATILSGCVLHDSRYRSINKSKVILIKPGTPGKKVMKVHHSPKIKYHKKVH